MGVPTSEVGYTSAMPRREDQEVHKDMWGHWGEGGYLGKKTDIWVEVIFLQNVVKENDSNVKILFSLYYCGST